MTPSLSSSARRVQEFLNAHGASLDVVELPASTRSAREAAQAVGCDEARIAKSLVFKGKESGRPVLVIASGVNRVDESRVAEVIGEAIGRASPDFVRERTGYAIGGVPPVAHAEPILTLVDRDLLALDAVWAAAGTPHAVFRLTPSELVRLTDGEVADVKLA